MTYPALTEMQYYIYNRVCVPTEHYMMECWDYAKEGCTILKNDGLDVWADWMIDNHTCDCSTDFYQDIPENRASAKEGHKLFGEVFLKLIKRDEKNGWAKY